MNQLIETANEIDRILENGIEILPNSPIHERLKKSLSLYASGINCLNCNNCKENKDAIYDYEKYVCYLKPYYKLCISSPANHVCKYHYLKIN